MVENISPVEKYKGKVHLYGATVAAYAASAAL